MRIRAAHLLVPVLILAVSLALSGCGLIKKRKKTFDDTPTPTPLADLEPPAVNRADLTRFPDELLIHGQTDLVRQITFARTAPNEGGSTVAVIDANTPVLKWSLRSGNTLVSFDRAAFPGKRFAGWISDSAFSATVAAGTVPTVKPVVPPPTATVAGTNPASGTCTLQLRSTSFSPSTASCQFEEKVRSGSPATFTFPCAGGAAIARFGSQTFSGTADPKKVSLTNTTLFPFSGCQVRAFQTITGTPPNPAYSYAETIISGKCPTTSTCTARGTVSAN